MPNWCNNRLTISHKDKDVLDNLMALIRADEDERLFKHIKPMPEELRDTVKGTGDEKQTTKYDGYTNWYDWSCARWGTKWDAFHMSWHQVDDNIVQFDFDSAWSPPIPVYKALAEQGFEVEAYYVEYGCGFAGEWHCDAEGNGTDDFSNDIDEYVPEGVDEVFGVTETLEEWKQEELAWELEQQEAS